MTDTFEFTLDNPLTEEQWDMITDVDFDRTDRIAFRTKHGKEVEFAKVIRCKDCKYLWQEVAEGFTPYGFYNKRHIFLCQKHFDKYMGELREVMIDDFCSWAERKEE